MENGFDTFVYMNTFCIYTNVLLLHSTAHHSIHSYDWCSFQCNGLCTPAGLAMVVAWAIDYLLGRQEEELTINAWLLARPGMYLDDLHVVHVV